MRRIIALLCMLFVAQVYAQTPTHYYVEMKTSKGDLLLKLYNETPQHRDNFKKLVKEGYFDSLLFHRVIHNFMIQGGDPQSKDAVAGQALGSGGPTYRVPAEIRTDIIHKKGALGAARDNNPEKASSASQFYLVQGRSYSQAGLDSLQELRMKGVKFTDKQRQTYTTIGGTPHLDGNYTVFGEILQGLDVVDVIAKVKTNAQDRPEEDVRMAMRMLGKGEAENLERVQNGLKPKKSLLKKSKRKDYTIQ